MPPTLKAASSSVAIFAALLVLPASGTESLSPPLLLLSNQCGAYIQAGQYTAALPVCQRLADALEPTPDKLTFSQAIRTLGIIALNRGDYAQAEARFLRSLAISENYAGRDHPDVAQSLGSLAYLYHVMGQYSQSEQFYLRSLRIYETRLGPEALATGNTYHNMGMLFMVQEEWQKAESNLQRGLAIREKVLGPDNSEIGDSLRILGDTYSLEKKYQQAEPLYLRSLQIAEKANGKQHITVANAVSSLANLYRRQGEYEKAEPLYLRSLRIKKNVLGPDHPEIAPLLLWLGLTDLAQGQPARALPRWTRMLVIQERLLRSTTTEARVTSLLETMRGYEDVIYSLLLLPQIPQGAKQLALSTGLLRKGRTAETGLMTGRALWKSLDDDAQQQGFQKWQALRVQQETLTLQGAGAEGVVAQQEQLITLQNQIDAQAQVLAQASPLLSSWKTPAAADVVREVAAKLPRDGALIEILWMQPRKFQAQGMQQFSGEPRYLALLLFPTGRVEYVDLGLAEQLDQAVGGFLVAARNPAQDPLPTAQALYQKVFAPLLPLLHAAKKLYLSLDESLNLIPFAALHDGQRYLLDSPYELFLVTSGRDLLRESFGQSVEPPLVLADPDYGQTLAVAPAGETRSVDRDTLSLYESVESLPRLAGTRREGELLQTLLGVSTLMDAAATETALRTKRAPSLLHIATHGVFLGGAAAPGQRSALRKVASPKPAGSLPLVLGQSQDYSLLRSALALAGAAHAAQAKSSAQDGLLTAEEARSLNLFGTQLVVLSACDTGRGSVKVGQGVYGLQRSFFVAGADTVVTSLWPVSDPGTQSLMDRYYRLLLDKHQRRGRVSGLAEAMRAVKAVHPHPYYWAPFVAIGSDGPLTIPTPAPAGYRPLQPEPGPP